MEEKAVTEVTEEISDTEATVVVEGAEGQNKRVMPLGISVK